MRVKKLGKAEIELTDELWFVEGRADQYHMNRRLVDTRPDVKSFKAQYVKMIRKNTPAMKQPQAREEYFKIRDEYSAGLKKLLTKVYQEIKEESFTYPIPLRRAKDFDHRSDWRCCLYKGEIYQFDRGGYSSGEMAELIWEFEQQTPTA